MSQDIQRMLFPYLVGRLQLHQSYEDQLALVDKVLQTESRFAGISSGQRNEISREFLALGRIDFLARDPLIEDIMINATEPVYAYHAQAGMMQTEVRFSGIDELEFFTEKLVVLAGKTEVRPILDLQLPGGLRVNSVQSPFGPQITIRRMKETPPSIVDLMDWNLVDSRMAAEMWLYVDGLRVRPANIFVGGPAGSGKTTLLNSLFSFFRPEERIITIEDTLELNTRTAENCSRLEVNESLSAQDLVKNALRMRPDRIIVGEMRGAEAQQLITAMNIGATCMVTIHTDTSRNLIKRLSNNPMNISEDMLALLDVIFIVRALRDGPRLHRAVVEVVETAGLEGKTMLLTEPQTYNLQQKKLIEKNSSRTVFRDRLARATGWTNLQIMGEIERRQRVLEALLEQGIRAVADISRFARDYYDDTAAALRKIGLEDDEPAGGPLPPLS
jgi:flagellar protein FlaI